MLFWAKGKKCGIQRKELKDLLASVNDGRLAKELQQMQAANIGARLLIVEGKPQWTTDGTMMQNWGQTWTKRQLTGLLWSVQEAGVWISITDGLSETLETVSWFMTWCSKEHRSLVTRPGPGAMWGTSPTDKEWGSHLLQGIPGIGPEIANRIVREFGRVPLGWNVEREEMMKVEGLGKKRVEQMWRVLDPIASDGS